MFRSQTAVAQNEALAARFLSQTPRVKATSVQVKPAELPVTEQCIPTRSRKRRKAKVVSASGEPLASTWF